MRKVDGWSTIRRVAEDEMVEIFIPQLGYSSKWKWRLEENKKKGQMELKTLLFACLFVGIYLHLVMSKIYPTMESATEDSDSELTFRADPVGSYKSRRGTLNTVKYSFVENGRPASFKRFYTLLSDQESRIHRVFLNVFLNFPSSGAVFWECAPITAATYDTTQFEFILMDAPSLAERTVDMEPFSDKFQEFKDAGDVISFSNVGGDAMLVIPTPPKQPGLQQHFTHLESFLKHAISPQVSSLWVRVAREVNDTLLKRSLNQRLWVSTSGLGVSWLHIRLDSVPKYYNWRPYKDGSYEGD